MNGGAAAEQQSDSIRLTNPSELAGNTPSSGGQPEDSTIYKWDDQIFDWVEIGELERLNHPSNNLTIDIDVNNPTEVRWEVLMNILYQLKYYSELDLSIFAPVFGPNLERLDGQTVVIDGYILPIDEEQGIWALSAFPVASCFFCGQASPSSVISIYFSENQGRTRYATGDRLSLTGTLTLNHDDPVELYYILKEAEGRLLQ